MRLKILYFANLRELLKVTSEEFSMTSQAQTLADLKASLAERGDQWHAIMLDNPNLLVAINQETVSGDAILNDGDEVAFFPPVTGG